MKQLELIFADPNQMVIPFQESANQIFINSAKSFLQRNFGEWHDYRSMYFNTKND